MKTSKKSSCPAQAMLELLGKPHMLHIIHTFGSAEWGFSEFQKQTGINTRTLTKRLQELQEEKIIVSSSTKDGRCKNYQLTKKGSNIDSILKQLPNL